MKINKLLIAITAIAIIGFLMPAAASAHGHSGVRIGIGIGVPVWGCGYWPGPCYYPYPYYPPVVYVEPAPVVVAAPVVAPAPVVVAPPVAAVSTDAVTSYVNVTNSNGSITPVRIRRIGNVWVGPKGEQYLSYPKMEQLKPVYGF
jgi:hypothetical protein